MLRETVTYFQKAGPHNTRETLRLAVEAARALETRQLVLASTEGDTAAMLADEFDCTGLSVTVVTYASGQTEAGKNPMSGEMRRRLEEKGFRLCTAAHALSGAERSLSTTFGGVCPVEIIAHTLRMLCQGAKVCVEIGAMAADAGHVVGGQPIVAVGGSARGADTAMVLRPEVSSKILKTKLDRILCKPLA